MGSINPVGRIICSINSPWVCSNSQGPGVAETNTVWGRKASHSSNFKGRLSLQDGKRKPYSLKVSLRERSPLYMPLSWGTVTWLSSTIKRAFFGKYSKRVGGGSPGALP